MRNREVADILHRIGDILDIQGDDPFKSRAYRRAARSLESMAADVEALHREGRLTEIAGVGEALAKKIDEYLSTGRLGFLERLEAALPPDVLEMLEVPGLGPKTVGLLYREAGVQSLEELKAAAQQGRLRRLKGMGPKKEQNILRAIETLSEIRGRTLLSEARGVADAMLAELSSAIPLDSVSCAGSLRRMRETVGDIDLVAVHEDGAAATAAFTSMSRVRDVVLQGDTKATVIVRGGIQVDLRVVPRESYGAALQYFTGSKDHNIRLRGMAVERGLKLNEYGLFKGEERVAGEDEEGIYAALGLPYIEPELREDAGEIRAAEEGRLPDLVDMEEIKGDLHIHTAATDGIESLEGMAEAARERGYAYLGIADHSQSLRVAKGLSAEAMEAHLEAVRELSDDMEGITLLAGSEVDVLEDGSLDYPDSILDAMDYVVAAVHSKFRMPRAEMTARMVKAVESGYVSVLAHPTCRKIGGRDPVDVDLDALFKAAVDAGTAMEINATSLRMDLNGEQARRAKDAGARFVVSTDAHSIPELDQMRCGVGLARRGWLEAGDVMNTLPAEELLKSLK